MDISKKIGQNIKNIRERKKMTQVALAKKTNISARALCKMEKQGSNFQILTLVSISKALGVGLEEVLGLKGCTHEDKLKYCVNFLNQSLKD